MTSEYDNNPEAPNHDSPELRDETEREEIHPNSSELKQGNHPEDQMVRNDETKSDIEVNEEGSETQLADVEDTSMESSNKFTGNSSNDLQVDDGISNTDNDNVDDESNESSPRRRVIPALSALAIGLAIGIVISGIGVIRTQSSQSSLASFLVKTDGCGANTTLPSGVCFNSPVSVNYNPTNPLNQFLATPGTINLSATQARIGIFGNSTIKLQIAGLETSTIGNLKAFNSSTSGNITGSISMPYSQLTHTLQSGSNTGAKIFYVGANEIGTSNNISYQGKTIALEVTSKIALSKNELYLTPVTVTALGHTAPASSVFSNTSPVPVTIPKLPSGMKYSSLNTTKSQLVFNFTGSKVKLGSLFNAK